MGNGSGAGGVSDALVTSASLDPTGTMLVSVSGQNATSAAAGSMNCRFFTVEYIPS
jgi:tetrahydromethanopterin S-methyltransferase subunit B